MATENKQSNRNAARIWTNKQNNIHSSVSGSLLQAYKSSTILLWSVSFKCSNPHPQPPLAPQVPHLSGQQCDTCWASCVGGLPAVCRIRTQRGYRGRSSVRGSPCLQSPSPRALPLQPQTVVWNDSTRVTSVRVILQQWTLITDS